jgi:hypothetical protein
MFDFLLSSHEPALNSFKRRKERKMKEKYEKLKTKSIIDNKII